MYKVWTLRSVKSVFLYRNTTTFLVDSSGRDINSRFKVVKVSDGVTPSFSPQTEI